MKLTDPVSTIKGIGPKKEKALAATGINTLQDIIYFFPRSYEDKRIHIGTLLAMTSFRIFPFIVSLTTLTGTSFLSRE